MLHWSELAITETIFTHVLPSGENINVASERLRKSLLALPPSTQPQPHLIPINKTLAESFITHNIVNMTRVRALRVLHCREPVIFCKDGNFTDGRPDVFFVDGHHRYVRAFIENCPVIEGWVLPTQFWHPFIITGLPDQTKEQLEASPTLTDHVHYGAKP